MLKVILERARQKHRTIRFPEAEPVLPERFRGRPSVDFSKCPDGCGECARACPVDAIVSGGIDLGRCIFCGDCVPACEKGAIAFTKEYRLAASDREDLTIWGEQYRLARAMGEELKKLYGRSFRLRQVSAGGCNACEADANVLTTVVFDLGRFGIDFVASPRHADGLLVTGPAPKNMELALRKTYEAVPEPRLVIASGSCAISGGPFAGNSEVLNGAASVVPVDLFIPGCPPHPVTLLDGLLRLIGRIK